MGTMGVFKKDGSLNFSATNAQIYTGGICYINKNVYAVSTIIVGNLYVGIYKFSSQNRNFRLVKTHSLGGSFLSGHIASDGKDLYVLTRSQTVPQQADEIRKVCPKTGTVKFMWSMPNTRYYKGLVHDGYNFYTWQTTNKDVYQIRLRKSSSTAIVNKVFAHGTIYTDMTFDKMFLNFSRNTAVIRTLHRVPLKPCWVVSVAAALDGVTTNGKDFIGVT